MGRPRLRRRVRPRPRGRRALTVAATLDHLVVTAPDLDPGVAWVESVLGVAPQPGGEHPRMGTHNALLRLGESTYLEVLAASRAAPPPSRPRWFELDRLPPGSPPRLIAWVARSGDLRALVDACGHSFGSVEAMSRGAFEWLIAIPPDGRLLGGGVIPMLIEWMAGGHPAAALPDVGLTLASLQLTVRDPAALSEALACLGVTSEVDVHAGEEPGLVAVVDTPRGRITMGGTAS